MATEFVNKLRSAFPAGTDRPVVQSLAAGVALADDVRRNTPWLMNLVGDDLRGNLRRAAAMWRFSQDCKNGVLPFKAQEVANTTGSSHLLMIVAGAFEAHIVRTEGEASFPKDAPIRQDKRLSNEADLFIGDGKLKPVDVAGVENLYAWLSFGADLFGTLSHVCWCMPAAEQREFLARINILREANMFAPEPAPEPPPPNPADQLEFRREIERMLDERGGVERRNK